MAYSPIIFVSAVTKQRIEKLPQLIKQVYDNHEKRVQSSALNDVIMAAVAVHPTPTVNGKRLRIYYATQVKSGPPTFVVFVNNPDLMHFSYVRFLENQIRENFDFTGTPIRIIKRSRK